MKYRVLTIIVIIMMLFSITVSAQGYEYKISSGTDFISAKSDDDLTALSQKLDVTSEQLSEYFQENGIIYLAVSDIEKSQIKISVSSDDFSSQVTDISQLDDQSLAEFAKLFGGEEETQIVTNNGRKYICTKSTKTADNITFTVTQYVTICNQKTFYFTAYNEGEDISALITSAFESFELNENTDQSPAKINYTLWIALTVIGAVIFAVIAVIMIVKIIASVKNKNEN